MTSVRVCTGSDLAARLGFAGTGVVDTSEYDWIDDDGVAHHAVEHEEALLLSL
jgi:hypothetical protein